MDEKIEEQDQHKQDRQDLEHANTRRVHLIWEYTQAVIAIMVTLTALADISLTTFLSVKGEIAIAALVFITNAFSLVVGFYFNRTGHNGMDAFKIEKKK